MIYNKIQQNILTAYNSNNTSSSKFSIINQSSNININKCKISKINSEAISYNLANSKITVDNCILCGLQYKNILTLNSEANVTDNNIIDSKLKDIIQIGSIYNYDNYIISTNLDNFLNSQNFYSKQEIIIPSTFVGKNKKQFIQQSGTVIQIDSSGDGLGKDNSLHFSSNYLTNGTIPYWSSIYKGFFTQNSIISLNKQEQIINFFNRIPRNLNGFTLTVNINTNVQNCQICKFYCGNIIINYFNYQIKNWNIHDNNCSIQLSGNTSPRWLNVDDNKKISLYHDNTQSLSENNFIFKGSNNMIEYKGKQILLFDVNNSFGNIVSCSLDDQYINSGLLTAMNNNFNGNMIYTPLSTEYTQLYDGLNNHIHNDLFNNDYFENQFRINDVRVKKFQDDSSIGTIIGWLSSNNNIPRGYYYCNGSQVPINGLNPNDENYNLELAILLNHNSTLGSSFILPNITHKQCNNQKLIYLIKYNNNFEN